MLSDEQLKKLIYETSIKRLKKNDINEKVLNDVLEYIENTKDNYFIVESIFNANLFSQIENGISRLEDIVIATKDSFYIYNFAFYVKGANIEKLEDAIIELGNVEYIYFFARDVKGANIEKLEDAIIETRNAEDIYNFAREVKRANIEKLEDAIIETKDAEYIYNFAENVKGANIEKLQDAIIETKNAEYIYNFAENVKGANKEKLQNAIMETKDTSYIYAFAENVKGVNYVKLKNEIEKICTDGRIENIYDFIKLRDKINELLEKPKYKIIFKYQSSPDEIGYATKSLIEEQNSISLLGYLIDNIDKEDNLIKLKIYGEFFKNFDNAKYDINDNLDNDILDEAIKLDDEYKEYVTKEKQKIKK